MHPVMHIMDDDNNGTIFFVKLTLLRGGSDTVSLIGNCRDGKTRQFGFVGFRTEEEAEAAAKYFHQSFFDTSRLTCEVSSVFIYALFNLRKIQPLDYFCCCDIQPLDSQIW